MPSKRDLVSARIEAGEKGQVFVPQDFAYIARRDVIDKTLQRLVASGELRRIDRGLYDRPIISALTERPVAPDYRKVIDAIVRRDQSRLLVDGITAANDLGLTDAVPSRVTIYSDTRRRSIQLDKLVIQFKMTAPSRLYWAGRPAMRIVQALHWLKDMLPSDSFRIQSRIESLLFDPEHGAKIRRDLADGFSTLPIWMQDFLRSIRSFEATELYPRGSPEPAQALSDNASGKSQESSRP